MSKTVMSSTRQGFTLIELIVAMVLVGVAATLVGTGVMSFTRIGEGKNYARYAQLAQQRMELILAQKRTKSGSLNCSTIDLDPCEDDTLKNNEFCKKVEADFNEVNPYCNVEVHSGGQKFYMQLYFYQDE
jgi:prepilin-type N-terminal cleavage/methylation domain-containing protein